MKIHLKALISIFILITSLCLLCSCGSSGEKIEGDWTVKSINGKSPADFASENGVYELGTAKNFSFTDKSVTVEAIDEIGNTETKTYDIEKTDKGLDVKAAGATISMEFLENEKVIRYSVKMNDVQYQYILQKGKTDLDSLKTVKSDRSKTQAVTDGTAETDTNSDITA